MLPVGGMVVDQGCQYVHLPRVGRQRGGYREVAWLQPRYDLQEPVQGDLGTGEVLQHLQDCAPCTPSETRLSMTHAYCQQAPLAQMSRQRRGSREVARLQALPQQLGQGHLGA